MIKVYMPFAYCVKGEQSNESTKKQFC